MISLRLLKMDKVKPLTKKEMKEARKSLEKATEKSFKEFARWRK